jgi:hypothetical protein
MSSLSMGTRSKVGWNPRCTERGPLGGDEIAAMLYGIQDRSRTNHEMRRRARTRLRRHARYLRTHIAPDDRTRTQRRFIEQFA